jgi:NAD(P)H-dependent flavin oxidoreductase YrpB (nitropropane dioxygenase family)
MLIVGHPWIKSQKFYKVCSLEDIKKSQADEIILLETLANSYALAQYCQENGIVYALETTSLDDALFANALGAKYMVCEENMALIIQPIAQEYLFDARVLVRIDNEKEMTKIAKAGIDGVIFAEAIC